MPRPTVAPGLLLALAACSASERVRFLAAPWAEDDTVVVVALDEDGAPDLTQVPLVFGGTGRFELDLERVTRSSRLALMSFSSGTRDALGLERCGAALIGTEAPLPQPSATFELNVDEDPPSLPPFDPNWGETPPRFATCSPTACDSVTVRSSVLPNQTDWRVQDLVPLSETRIVVNLADSSTTGPGQLLLVQRPAEILRAVPLTERASGMVQLGDRLFIASQRGALTESGPALSLESKGRTIGPASKFVTEPEGTSAIAFSFAHEDTRRVYEDGRVEMAPAELRGAFYNLAFGPNREIAAVRSVLPDRQRDRAISRFDGSSWRRVLLPSEYEDIQQLSFEGAEILVVTKKAVLWLSPNDDLVLAENVPAPFGQNFINLGHLGRGWVLSGHAGLLQRFGRNSHCILDSANHETIGDLVEISPRTLVAGWKFTRTQEPNLMWIDDALPTLE